MVTTLTEESLQTAKGFHFDEETHEKLVLKALHLSFLSPIEIKVIEARLRSNFERLWQD